MVARHMPFFNIKFFMSTFIVGVSQLLVFFIPQLFDSFFTNAALLEDLVSVDLVNRGSTANYLIHHRLSETILSKDATLADPVRYAHISYNQ